MITILNHSSTFGIFSQSDGNFRQIDIAESDSTSLSHLRSNLFYSPEKTAAELDGGAAVADAVICLLRNDVSLPDARNSAFNSTDK